MTRRVFGGTALTKSFVPMALFQRVLTAAVTSCTRDLLVPPSNRSPARGNKIKGIVILYGDDC
eukprot:12931050-Prorocentrum_lima.AAC.1